jgi:hypothetical protein
MKMNPLPPQAYTKETLLKAYSWLQNQSEIVRELATTPDILISLYTKAQMNGDSSLERPSIQNFKTELKNLAGLMGEFENLESEPIAEKKTQGLLRPQAQQVHNSTIQSQTTASSLGSDLDAKTKDLIREIMNECNLSSENEALRLLVSVGYKKIKNI